MNNFSFMGILFLVVAYLFNTCNRIFYFNNKPVTSSEMCKLILVIAFICILISIIGFVKKIFFYKKSNN